MIELQNKEYPAIELQSGGYPFHTAKEGDVGHDLYVSIVDTNTKLSLVDRLVSEFVGTPCMIIWPFSTKLVPSGIKVNQPNKLWCMITSRSSATKKSLMVASGIIDSGYQGDLFAALHNFGIRPRIVKEGERYAQAIFFSAVRPAKEYVDKFSNVSARGATGFGSSGR